jgi:hypothetical protein
MMRTLQGEIADDLTVSDSLTIQGHLSGDSLVLGGGHLLVQGTVTGRVEVEAEGSLHVQGTGGFRVTNRGLVMLGGTFDEDWLQDVASDEGTVVVWPGSLITTRVGRPYLVNADGSLDFVDGSSEVSTTVTADPARGFLVYRDGMFTPVPAADVSGPSRTS